MPETTSHDSRFVFIARLDPHLSRQVAALERRLHRPSQREGLAAIRELLQNATEGMESLSLGLFDRGRLVGYLIAYVRDQGFFSDSADEPVVYVHDVAVLPGYSSGLRRLLRRTARSFWLLVPELAVEAHFAPPEYKLSRLCTYIMRDRGYRAEEQLESSVTGSDAERMAIRWQLDPELSATGEAPSPPELGNRRPPAAQPEVEVVTTETGFRALRDDWQRLVGRLDDTTVFHSYDYQWQTWMHLGIANSLFIIVVRRGGEITGLAPLELRPRHEMNGWHRELALIGTPWEVERSRLLLEPADHETLDAITRCILDHRPAWDLCTLWEIYADDPPMKRFMDNLAGQGLLLAETHSSTCPHIDLRGSWEDYLAGRSRRMRKNLRRSRRQLEAMGSLEMREVHDSSGLPDGMADYLAVELNSWKAHKDLGIGRDLWYYGYFTSLAQHFGKTGRFDLRVLTLDGKPIAATFGIRDRGTFYSLRIAHDSDYNAYSPGTLLEAMELQSLFATDLERYDPLGGFLTNKLRWADTSVDTVTLHACQPTWRLQAFYFVYFRAKPLVRDLLKRLGLFEAAQDLQRRVERNRSRNSKKPHSQS